MVREGWRGRIAAGLLVLITGIVVGAFAVVALDWATARQLQDLLTAVFNPIVGLFGAVIGFYFGTAGQAESDPKVRTRPAKRKGES